MGEKELALFGAPPMFDKPVLAGQRYFPSRERYLQAFRGIFDRQYYTEYGPLNQQLEQVLQRFLGVKHAICVTNETVGLMMVASAMDLRGKVILPALSPLYSAQVLSWAGLEPVFCDADPVTGQIDMSQAASLIDKDVSAIMGVHLWGGASNSAALRKLAVEHGLRLFFDAAHAFGCEADGIKIGNFGDAEVFSFHQDNIINAAEGGCICTSDDGLAAKLRMMRSSAGAGELVAVTKTVNGRMSEAQCAIALLNLEDFGANRKHNEVLFNTYESLLFSISGLKVMRPAGVSFSNYQHCICQVDEQAFGISAIKLVEVLKAENICSILAIPAGLHRSIPYTAQYPEFLDRFPVTDNFCAVSISLPLGSLIFAEDIERICTVLHKAHADAARIRSMMVTKGYADKL